MSIRVASSSWIAGAVVVGDPGFGVLAETIPSTGEHGPGYAYPSLEFPTDAGKEIAGRVTTWPTLGTLVAYEDTSFTYDGASDTFAFQLYVDGVATGDPATVTLQVGAVTHEAVGEIAANLASISGEAHVESGGAASVSSDSTAAYGVIAAVSADSSASYAVINPVSGDATTSYAVLNAVASDSSASYSVLTSASSDSTAAYQILSANTVASDSTASYAIFATVAADSTSSYAVLASASSDATASYGVLAAAGSDSAATYAVLATVSSDSTAAYAITVSPSADSTANYTIFATVAADSTASYSILYSGGEVTLSAETIADLSAAIANAIWAHPLAINAENYRAGMTLAQFLALKD